jgi:hypothetical protein
MHIIGVILFISDINQGQMPLDVTVMVLLVKLNVEKSVGRTEN